MHYLVYFHRPDGLCHSKAFTADSPADLAAKVEGYAWTESYLVDGAIDDNTGERVDLAGAMKEYRDHLS